ncbi:hypothetical protein B0H14DRAFT_2571346 [Mycena olivaceomarginata]|nr:hypothetical protein B0H14DRAFT_2571346 [Mycena olivaceomarginata]
MPPGRRKASGPAATAAPSNDPPPGSRPTRSSRRNPPPAEAEPPPPVRRPSNTEDAVGFAPLASLQSNRAARGRNQPAAPVALQNVQQIQQTPIRSRITPLHFSADPWPCCGKSSVITSKPASSNGQSWSTNAQSQ